MFFRRKPEEAAAAQDVEQPSESHQAVLRDELGLHHLWFLELRLDQELARASRTGTVFSLVAWQLRLLPNEAPSPELLAQAAALIEQSLRPYHIAARVDARRYVALLCDATYEAACTLAFRLKGDLQIRIPSAGRWQAGVASFGRDGKDVDTILQAAEHRLEKDARAA